MADFLERMTEGAVGDLIAFPQHPFNRYVIVCQPEPAAEYTFVLAASMQLFPLPDDKDLRKMVKHLALIYRYTTSVKRDLHVYEYYRWEIRGE